MFWLKRVAGVFQIKNKNNWVQNISFNYPKKESKLSYLKLTNLPNQESYTSIPDLFNEFENANRINELWKWFVTLALLFLLIEILILKLFK